MRPTPSCTLVLVLFAAWLPACAESTSGSSSATPAASGERESLGDPIAGTKVFDEKGNEKGCVPPEPRCAEDKQPSMEFKDRCRLAGFRLMTCGCETVCSGNVSGERKAYNAKNEQKICAPAKEDCSPPETSAAYQDACTEAGHKFVVCGCEWLCSGKLTGPVSATPPPPEDPEPAPEPPKKKKK